MSYLPSTPPDITEGLPAAITSAAAASSQVFDGKGRLYDVAISGIGFIMGATAQHIYQRETAPWQKEQIDTDKEAGEQSFDGYWVRSQVSWHMGAGLRFYEPGSQPDTEYRFDDSLGVDVWIKNRAILLHACTPFVTVSSGQKALVTGAVINGANVVFTNEHGVVRRRSATGSILQTYTSSGATPTTEPCVGAGKIFIDAGGAGIDASDATVGTALTHLYTQAAGLTPTLYWSKSRLIAARGASLYELAPDGSTAGGNIDNAVPIFTHPDPGWTWTGVTDGPNNIYAAGFSDGLSSIYKFVLEDAGINNTGLPKLSQGYQVFEMPHGEHIYSLKSSMGRYLGVGTSRGFRVGLISTSNYITLAGELQMGPLLFYTQNPITAITTGDRFFYVGVNNGYTGILGDPYNTFSGAVRIDLSDMVGGEQAGSIRFPWASDAQPGVTDRIDSIAMIGNTPQVVFGVYQNGIYGQSATLFEQTGWIRSGRIRYATVEQKTFRSMDVGVDALTGSLSAYTVDDSLNQLYLRTINASANDSSISLHTQTGTAEYLRFQLNLSPSPDQLTTPILNSMRVRALPAFKRQRMIQYPLICMDLEEFATGPKLGYEGFAIARLMGLEAIEQNGLVITVQDFTTNETFEAVIEKITFTRPGPRSVDGRKNFGGFLDVLVRKLV